jgi:hypothetical protein
MRRPGHADQPERRSIRGFLKKFLGMTKASRDGSEHYWLEKGCQEFQENMPQKGDSRRFQPHRI